MKTEKPPNKITEPKERWGTFADAEYWRKVEFMRKTPAQRLVWLQEMLDLAYASGALKPYSEDQGTTSPRSWKR